MFQKYSLIGNAFCDIYREHEYREMLLKLLKFSESSLVPSTSTKIFQQEQRKAPLLESVQQHIVIDNTTNRDRVYVTLLSLKSVEQY